MSLDMGSGAPASPSPAPDVTTAIPVRHPWRNLFAVVLLLGVALFLYDAFTNRPAYDWPAVWKYVWDRRISQAALVTLELTFLSMIGAVLLGVGLAIMRLSPNPVLKAVAWAFIWLFRGTPVYVQLVFWGLLATIYQTIFVGIPFTEIGVRFDTQDGISVFWLAVIGLMLNEAAYMSEIVRAGLLSVDDGQEEAARALGFSWWQTMRRIIIPQAMRVIIPPTGNEVISMLKTTSLVIAVPVSTDLYMRSRDISAETFNPVPLLIVASLWYLLFTSILMVGQYFLERHYGRGTRHVELGDQALAGTGEEGNVVIGGPGGGGR